MFGGPIYIRLARARGWVDRPGGRKVHAEPTPTMGGLLVFGVVFAGLAVTLLWGNRVTEMLREHLRYVLGAAGCTAVLLLVGAIDDRVGLRAKVKLLAQVLAAVGAYWLGFEIGEVTIPGVGSVALGGASFLLTVVWIVGVINAINFTDGMDGLAAGIGFLAAAVNAGVAIWLGNYYMAVMMLLLAGALLGFLRWNFHPARVFLGDAGSQALGGYLALCSLHSAQKSHTAVMILVPLCALGYPIFDLLLSVARRTIRGQPLFAGDRDHVHHRLLARGHSPAMAALVIYVGSLVLIGAGVLAMSANHLAIGLALAAVLALAVFSVRVLGYMEWGGWGGRSETRVLHAAAELTRRKLQLAERPDDVLAALAVFAAEAGFSGLMLEIPDCPALAWSPTSSTVEAPTAAAAAPGDVHSVARQQIDLPNGWIIRIAAPQHLLDDPQRRALLDELLRLTGARHAQEPLA